MARRTGAVVHVLIAECAGPAGVAGADEASRRRGQRASAVSARLRRAGVVHSLAIHAGEALGARAQVLIGRRVLTRSSMLAWLVRTTVIEI